MYRRYADFCDHPFKTFEKQNLNGSHQSGSHYCILSNKPEGMLGTDTVRSVFPSHGTKPTPDRTAQCNEELPDTVSNRKVQ